MRIIRWEAMRPRQTTIFGCKVELFPEPGHTGFALGGQRVAVLGRAALDDVGDVAVFASVQIDGKQVFVQQLAAAAHKGQALLVLALAGAFAHEQHLGIWTPCPNTTWVRSVHSSHLRQARHSAFNVSQSIAV